MNQKLQNLMLALFCLFVIALSAAGIVTILFSETITGVDALMLAATCLAMGGLFSLLLFWIARQAGWLPHFGKKSAGEKTAEVPADPPSKEKN